MALLETLKINNPKKPGEYLIINARDFDPAVHTRWVDPATQRVVDTDPPQPTVSSGKGNQLDGYIPPITERSGSRSRRGR